MTPAVLDIPSSNTLKKIAPAPSGEIGDGQAKRRGRPRKPPQLAEGASAASSTNATNPRYEDESEDDVVITGAKAAGESGERKGEVKKRKRPESTEHETGKEKKKRKEKHGIKHKATHKPQEREIEADAKKVSEQEKSKENEKQTDKQRDKTPEEREKELQLARKRVMDWESQLLSSSAPTNLPVDLSLKKAATPTTSFAFPPPPPKALNIKKKKKKLRLDTIPTGKPSTQQRKRDTMPPSTTATTLTGERITETPPSLANEATGENSPSEDGLSLRQDHTETPPATKKMGEEEEEELPAFNLDIAPPVVRKRVRASGAAISSMGRARPSVVFALDNCL